MGLQRGGGHKTEKLRLRMEEVHLPPFEDVLVLASKSTQGRNGLGKVLELLAPGSFEMIISDDADHIEAVFVSRKLIKKIGKEKVLSILEKYIFANIHEGEIVKVDFSIDYGEIEVNTEDLKS